MLDAAQFDMKLLDYRVISQELTLFLAKYDFLFNFKVTDFLRRRVWEKVPEGWLDALSELSFEELNEIPYGFTKECWPQSLLTFLSEALKLSSFHFAKDDGICPLEVVESCRFGMSPKKLHEVSHLASLINSVCIKSNCKYIVDIGSGLGYLDLVLCKQFGYEVLGLENQKSRVSVASKRTNVAKKKDRNDCMSGTFTQRQFELTNNEESIFQLEQLINELWSCDADFNVKGVCLIGLHCCGDLTPATLRAFSILSRTECLVCLSCCYHRMEPAGEGFLHFPLSSALKETMSEMESANRLEVTKYALRLAAQDTRSRWRRQTGSDHMFHTHSVAYRGIFELNDDLSFMKQKRKLVRRRKHHNFESYVDEVIKRTSLSGYFLI